MRIFSYSPLPVGQVWALALCAIVSLAGLTSIVMPREPQAAESPRLKERDYQRLLCDGMEQEIHISGIGRADCRDQSHIFEIDFANNWKSAIGQSFAYAYATDLRSGIVLVCRLAESDCLKYRLGIEQTLSAMDLPATLWTCGAENFDMAECRRTEFGQQ